ncbi:hypothetical protein Pfo_013562 [Paulownia fortunei]|nr:hypothetical protein Pfo_013562 [Paulownia fortunei]
MMTISVRDFNLCIFIGTGVLRVVNTCKTRPCPVYIWHLLCASQCLEGTTMARVQKLVLLGKPYFRMDPDFVFNAFLNSATSSDPGLQICRKTQHRRYGNPWVTTWSGGSLMNWLEKAEE